MYVCVPCRHPLKYSEGRAWFWHHQQGKIIAVCIECLKIGQSLRDMSRELRLICKGLEQNETTTCSG